jgi:type IV pilus assembly protein PilB
MTVASKPDTELLAGPEERPQPAAPFAPPEQADGVHMTRRLTTRLGQLLLDANLLSQSKLQSALERQKETGQRLGELLVTEGYIDEAALLPVLESQYGVPAAELDSVNLDADLATVITHDMAQRYLLVPLTLHADAVDVAMVDPTDFVAMAHVRFATGLRPNVFITTVTAAQRAIARLYGEPDTDTAEHPRDPREVVKQMILDRDSMLIAADQDPRKFYELAASIDLFVDEIFRNVNDS